MPSWLANIRSLQVIELSYNKFRGSIPGRLGNLSSLFYLDLSNNLFSGGFPLELTGLQALASQEAVKQVDRSYLELPVFIKPTNATNLQYNQLSSLPPTLYLQNNNLSGNIPVQIGQLKFLYVLDLSGDKDASLVVLFPNNTNEIKDLTIYELLKATDNFNHANIVGCEVFGMVYKAKLEDGSKLAVKKLSRDLGLMEKEFRAEFGLLVEMRRLMVHPTWIGPTYNRLGLSWLILPYHTHVTTELVGTLGYIPPEYGQAWVATLRGDIYSFGVVMFELLTGKRPMEVFNPKMSRELVGWVQQMRNEGKQNEVFDPLLTGKGFDDEMLQVLDVACMCVSQNPFKRPTTKEVVDWLKNVG
ncbi:hypothetical protein DKX38_004113 [Salix brachista]|uniref:Protein kinase domain-containing protein n=1 Tax=Salix brachista TaxID=2182728 RepID=A0A5N5N9Z0_9ROSI|nr:hypothetical protein DKX38_004113 [Salix brachista]